MTSLQTISLVVAVVAVLWISLFQPVDQWMQARAKAESIRADVFRGIMLAPGAGADASQLLRENFACFKSAHLDSQLSFFNRRGGQALRSCGRATPVRLGGYVLTVFAVLFGLAAFVNGWHELGLPIWRPVLSAADWFLVPHAKSLATWPRDGASSLLAFASAKSLMDQDERNATCYRAAADQIKVVVDADLAKTEQAAANGDAEKVLAFCERVQSILAARIWRGCTRVRPTTRDRTNSQPPRTSLRTPPCCCRRPPRHCTGGSRRTQFAARPRARRCRGRRGTALRRRRPWRGGRCRARSCPAAGS